MSSKKYQESSDCCCLLRFCNIFMVPIKSLNGAPLGRTVNIKFLEIYRIYIRKYIVLAGPNFVEKTIF